MFTPFAINKAIDAITGQIGFVSLHNGFPGTTGANEIAGVTRLAVTYNAASNGIANTTAAVSFLNVPGNSNVLYHGLWTAQTGGTFIGYAPAGSNIFGTFTANGTSNILTRYSHGLESANAAKNRVIATKNKGVALPTSISEGTVYWIINETLDTVQIAATQNGTPIDIGNGECVFYNIIPSTDVLPFTHEVSTFTILGY